ncbi:RecQ family ATP-dependent DNA helicase [Pseudomonas nitroreducens]|uniref:RecQ family ATP-dependent DNA helicase n=1 Tax=Pseudomonas nitroreducens TaxID=46680 RepID=UPI00162263BF|nr:ATP-dependent DNA helicase RecQ [Pseudomonas nitritireducens]
MIDPKDGLRITLKKYFGFDELRPGQVPIVDSVLNGRDILAILKTSGGKSLCYQLPAIHLGGTTIVISPLISLMKDQVEALDKKGISATFANSSIPAGEMRLRYEGLSKGKYTLFYISPERMKDPEFLGALIRSPVRVFAVDEAHCASQWGHNFRPAYAKVGEYLDEIEDYLQRPIQRLAFTATANSKVQEDIVRMLRLKAPEVHIQDFDRDNITYSVIPCANTNRSDDVLRLVMEHPEDCIIVYCVTVKEVEKVCHYLQDFGVQANRYHGKLPTDEKNQIQEDFLNDKIRVLVATSAFGMGVDKPNVRLVIHPQMPGSVEAYSQESGRAGRDGLPAKAILLYHPNDRSIHAYFIGVTNPNGAKIEPIKRVIGKILVNGPAPLSFKHISLQASRQQSIINSVLEGLNSSQSDIKMVDVQATVGMLVNQGELEVFEGVYTLANWQDDSDYYWIEEVRKNDWSKLSAMCNWCETNLCRRWTMLRYFDERKPIYRCGMCDNCQRESLSQLAIGPLEKTVRTSTLINLAKNLQPLVGAEGSRWLHVLLGTLSPDELTPGEQEVFGRFAWNAVSDIRRWRDMLVEREILTQDNALTEQGHLWIDGKLVIEPRSVPQITVETGRIVSIQEVEQRMKVLKAWRKATAYREDCAEIQICSEAQLKKIVVLDDVTESSLTGAGFNPSWLRKYAGGVTLAISKIPKAEDVSA